jgi:pimeloyl-ACP methyl ester carboxylesterase
MIVQIRARKAADENSCGRPSLRTTGLHDLPLLRFCCVVKRREPTSHCVHKERKNVAYNLDMTAQSHTVDLPAGRFHYRSWGAERTERPAALLLHGITSTALSWVRVGPALADHYRVYALDMRGHGDSIKPARGAYSLRHTADDAAAFMKVLGLEDSILMGHSWGGATAIMLASGEESQEPAPHFSHVILVDPVPDFSQGNAEERATAFSRNIGRPTQELHSEIAAGSPGWTQADIEGQIDGLHKVTRETLVNIFAEATPAGSILPLLAKIAAPTLLIRADPALGTTLAAAVWEQARLYLSPQSQAVQLDGATHNIHRSKFDEFMQIVNKFIE